MFTEYKDAFLKLLIKLAYLIIISLLLLFVLTRNLCICICLSEYFVAIYIVSYKNANSKTHSTEQRQYKKICPILSKFNKKHQNFTHFLNLKNRFPFPACWENRIKKLEKIQNFTHLLNFFSQFEKSLLVLSLKLSFLLFVKFLWSWQCQV